MDMFFHGRTWIRYIPFTFVDQIRKACPAVQSSIPACHFRMTFRMKIEALPVIWLSRPSTRGHRWVLELSGVEESSAFALFWSFLER